MMVADDACFSAPHSATLFGVSWWVLVGVCAVVGDPLQFFGLSCVHSSSPRLKIGEA